MKKYLISIILTFISLSAIAQVCEYQSYEYAEKNNITKVWSQWQPSNVRITIDFYNDIIIIYSPTIQKYKVVEKLPNPYDSTGVQEKYKTINQYGYYTYIRFRIAYDGTSQIYVDFADGNIVYNVIRL